MILDNLTQASRYHPLSPHFAKAFAFLNKFDGSLKEGRYEIDGENAYALVQRYTTKSAATAQFEAHRRYIDVQFVHAGRETILWASLAALTPTQDYNAEKDYELFSLVPTATPLRLGPGQFAILFPTDGHAPCCEWDAPTAVTKVVVKVKV